MDRKQLLVAAGLALLLALSGGLIHAQGPNPQEEQAQVEGAQPQAPLGSGPLAALSTGFTYQGQLRDSGGNPIDSTCDFTFSLWDSLSSGTQIGGDSAVTGVTVENGYFTAIVNGGGEFGAGAFAGEARWLEVTVQCTGDASPITLSPRQALNAAPYARYSMGAPWSGLTGVPDLQMRITGTCEEGNAIRIVNANGSVMCQEVPTDHWGESWTGTGTGLTLSGGDVGLSGSGTTYGLQGRSEATDGYGVYGYNDATSGGTHGVHGQVASNDGSGVYGRATSTSGYAYGVNGYSESSSGRGVGGWATATTGQAYGVAGRSYSDEGAGVYGYANSADGTTSGVYGRARSPDGTGVYGYVYSSSGSTYGVRGEVNSTGGFGVYGHATADEGSTYGVYGWSESTSGCGVFGRANATSGTTWGVYGLSGATSGYGVYGYSSASTGGNHGVYGQSNSIAGTGVRGTAVSNTGTTFGVIGSAYSDSGYGVYYIGGLGGTGLKTSVVETADYGWRHLYTMESPGNWFEDFGSAQLVDGRAVVAIEPIFAQTVNLEQPYLVFLTPQGDCGLYVADKTASSFTVRALDGKACSIAFDYRIVARRLGYEDVRMTVAASPPAPAAAEPVGGE